MRKTLLLTPLAALVLSLASLTNVLAISVDVSGNGAGSSNQVNVDQQNTNNVNQSNQSNVNNSVNSNCNTGGNSASQNTGGNASVNTGDCSSNVNIQNNLNSNQATVGCCQSPSPSPKPSTTPTGGPGGGGGGGAGGGGGGGAGGGQVLGATGVAENLALLSLGMTMVLGGLWQVRRAVA